MKVIVLGSQGMAGHLISKYLKSQNHKVFDIARTLPCDSLLDAENLDSCREFAHSINKLNTEEQPDAIINCIGLLVKASENNPSKAILVNSWFPHFLEESFKKTSIKLIHLSTDCVFDGKAGNYTENSLPNETNYYGWSKALGEVINSKDLTIRTSIVGTELKSEGSGLLEWVLRQRDTIRGYSEIFWNGCTTLELAKFINSVILTKKNLNYLYHLISPYPISKYNLIKLICEVWGREIVLFPDNSIKSNKTLINTRKEEFDYSVSDYFTQLKELYEFAK